MIELLLALACSGPPGAPGARGEPGPQGDRGPAGEAGQRGSDRALYRWADASGRLATTTEQLQEMDRDGLVWQINPESATLVGVSVDAYYESGDCSGEPYLLVRSLPPPRVAISTPDGLAWERPDDDPLYGEARRLWSVEAHGPSIVGCSEVAERLSVVAESELEQAVAPWHGWAAPLHPVALIE